MGEGTRERKGAKEVRKSLRSTVVEYKSKVKCHQETETNISLCLRSRSRSGERYRYVCSVAFHLVALALQRRIRILVY